MDHTEIDLNKTGCGVDTAVSGQAPVACYCEHSNDSLGYINRENS